MSSSNIEDKRNQCIKLVLTKINRNKSYNGTFRRSNILKQKGISLQFINIIFGTNTGGMPVTNSPYTR